MTSWSGAACVAVVSSAFLASAALKHRDLASTERWIGRLGLGIPRATAARSAVALEYGVACLVLGAPRMGGVASVALLSGLSVVLVVAGRRGVGCACFGRRETSTRFGLVRNVGLVAAGLIAVLAPPGPSERVWSLGVVLVVGLLVAITPMRPVRHAPRAAAG